MYRNIKLVVEEGVKRADVTARAFFHNNTAYNLPTDYMSTKTKYGADPNARALNMFHQTLDKATDAAIHENRVQAINKLDAKHKDPNPEYSAAATTADDDGHDYEVLVKTEFHTDVVDYIFKDEASMRELYQTFFGGIVFIKDEHIEALTKMSFTERLFAGLDSELIASIAKHNAEVQQNQSAIKDEGIWFDHTHVVKTRDQETLNFDKITVKRVTAGTTPAHGLVGTLIWEIMRDADHPGRVIVAFRGAGQSYAAMVDKINNIFAKYGFPLMVEIWKRRMMSKCNDGANAKTIDQIIQEDNSLRARVAFMKLVLVGKPGVFANEALLPEGKFKASLPADFTFAKLSDSQYVAKLVDDFIREKAHTPTVTISAEEWRKMAPEQFNNRLIELEKQQEATDQAMLDKVFNPGVYVGLNKLSAGLENMIFSERTAPWTNEQGSKIADKVGSIAKAVLTATMVMQLQGVVRDAMQDASAKIKDPNSDLAKAIGAENFYDADAIQQAVVADGVLEDAQARLAENLRHVKAQAMSQIPSMSEIPEAGTFSNLSLEEGLNHIIIPGFEKPALQGENAYMIATLTTETKALQLDITNTDDVNKYAEKTDDGLAAARKASEVVKSQEIAAGTTNSAEVAEAEANLHEFERKAEQAKDLVKLHGDPETAIGNAKTAEEEKAKTYAAHPEEHFTGTHKG